VVVVNPAEIDRDMVAVAESWGDELSFTVMETFEVPALVGVPLITPVELFRLRPPGKPVALHVYGVLPPVAAKVALYRAVTVPLGSDVVVMVNATEIDKDNVAVAESWGEELSLTVTETLKFPPILGVPLITPVELFKPRPPGKPAALHVYGVLPPVAAKAALYGAVTVPLGNDVVVIVSATEIDRENVAVAESSVELSLTITEMLKVPVVFGVPLMTPVELFTVRPAGKPEALHVYGVVPPFADRLALYGRPTVPPGSDAVVIVNAVLPGVELPSVMLSNPM
jgi:hypothetical protein